jgi:hypothetical protein
MINTVEPGTTEPEPAVEKFTTAVEIVVCAECAMVLANGTDGWGLDEAGRELGEVHAAAMREADVSIGCLQSIPERAEECPDHGEWLSAVPCEMCGDQLFGSRLSAVEFCVSAATVDVFLAGYVECALWSTTDEDGVPLDGRYGVGDLSVAAWLEMHTDCSDFVAANADRLDAYLRAGRSPTDAGHDWWLTRNRHGAGFWDRGLGELGAKLTAAAHSYGTCDLYVGDDGQVQVC